jgi:hypothetical protein
MLSERAVPPHHIRPPLLAAAPKFLILEVIELYRVEAIFMRHLAARTLCGPPAESSRGWSSLAQRLVFVCCAPRQAAFIAAPSGISPGVTQRQRVIRSFRASATIVTRRITPAFVTHARAKPSGQGAVGLMPHPQPGHSIMMWRRRGLPAFEIPCSRSIEPLRHGVGARPA